MNDRAHRSRAAVAWTVLAWWFLCSPVFWIWQSGDSLLDTLATALLLSPVFLWRRTAQVAAGLLVLVGAVYLGYFLAVGTIPDEYFWFTLFASNLGEAAEYVASYRLRDGLLLSSWVALAVCAAWWIAARPPRLHPLLRGGLAVVLLLWLIWAGIMACKGKDMQQTLNDIDRIYPVSMIDAFVRQRLVQEAIFNIPMVPPPARQARADIVVVVVGESASALRWSLLDYQKHDTNASLAPRRRELVALPVMANGNNTARTVPMLLTGQGLDVPEQGVLTYLDWARAAGFDVTTLSNSPVLRETEAFYHVAYHQRSDLYAQLPRGRNDSALTPMLRNALSRQDDETPIFINVHTYGSHPRLERRYPPDAARWADPYDNSIAWSSNLLAEWTHLLDQQEGRRRAVLLYISDHGLNFPDCGGKYTHGQAQSAFQVPFMIWANAAFRADQSDWLQQVARNAEPAQGGLPRYDNRVFSATVADLLGFSRDYPSLGQAAAAPPPMLNDQPFADLVHANACNVLGHLR